MTDRFRYALAWLALAVVLLLAYAELRRIASGQLFLLSTAWETPPSRVELADAWRTAKLYTWPALVAILAIGTPVIVWLPRRSSLRVRRPINRWLIALFVLSALADLFTTVRFFHLHGIDHEVHPAIRLFGYAYGRTLGPILGKSLQAIGLIWLSIHLPKHGKWILIAATALYFAAAAYNLSQN